MRRSRRAGSLLLLAIAGVFAVGSGHADAAMRVIQSNVPQYPVGMDLTDPPRLGAGCYLRVLSPTGETELLEGPKQRSLPSGVTRAAPVPPC
jgi:hypothetical protein